MTLHRRLFRAALAGGAALALGVFNAQAAPTLLVEGGVLMGADNVMVDGVSYNVRFMDGSCASNYQQCDAADDFIFDTKKEAAAASAALLSEVLVGDFDSDPSLVFGCDAARCNIFTAYGNNRSRALLSTAANTARRDRVSSSRMAASRDTTANARATYAVWSKSTETSDEPETTVVRFVAPQLEVLVPPVPADTGPNAPGQVPEPGMLALLGLAVPLLGWARRRGRAAAAAA